MLSINPDTILQDKDVIKKLSAKAFRFYDMDIILDDNKLTFVLDSKSDNNQGINEFIDGILNKRRVDAFGLFLNGLLLKMENKVYLFKGFPLEVHELLEKGASCSIGFERQGRVYRVSLKR